MVLQVRGIQPGAVQDRNEEPHVEAVQDLGDQSDTMDDFHVMVGYIFDKWRQMIFRNKTTMIHLVLAMTG